MPKNHGEQLLVRSGGSNSEAEHQHVRQNWCERAFECTKDDEACSGYRCGIGTRAIIKIAVLLLILGAAKMASAEEVPSRIYPTREEVKMAALSNMRALAESQAAPVPDVPRAVSNKPVNLKGRHGARAYDKKTETLAGDEDFEALDFFSEVKIREEREGKTPPLVKEQCGVSTESKPSSYEDLVEYTTVMTNSSSGMEGSGGVRRRLSSEDSYCGSDDWIAMQVSYPCADSFRDVVMTTLSAMTVTKVGYTQGYLVSVATPNSWTFRFEPSATSSSQCTDSQVSRAVVVCTDTDLGSFSNPLLNIYVLGQYQFDSSSPVVAMKVSSGNMRRRYNWPDGDVASIYVNDDGNSVAVRNLAGPYATGVLVASFDAKGTLSDDSLDACNTNRWRPELNDGGETALCDDRRRLWLSLLLGPVGAVASCAVGTAQSVIENVVFNNVISNDGVRTISSGVWGYADLTLTAATTTLASDPFDLLIEATCALATNLAFTLWGTVHGKTANGELAEDGNLQ